PAHEEAHDADAAGAAGLELFHCRLDGGGVGHAEGDLDVVAVAQRREALEDAPVPFGRSAVGHDQHAEAVIRGRPGLSDRGRCCRTARAKECKEQRARRKQVLHREIPHWSHVAQNSYRNEAEALMPGRVKRARAGSPSSRPMTSPHSQYFASVRLKTPTFTMARSLKR